MRIEELHSVGINITWAYTYTVYFYLKLQENKYTGGEQLPMG